MTKPRAWLLAILLILGWAAIPDGPATATLPDTAIPALRNGHSIAYGAWWPDEGADHPIPIDPETGVLDAGECDAAARNLYSDLAYLTKGS